MQEAYSSDLPRDNESLPSKAQTPRASAMWQRELGGLRANRQLHDHLVKGSVSERGHIRRGRQS